MHDLTARATWAALLALAAGLAGCATPSGPTGMPALAQPAADQPHARLQTRSTAPAGHVLAVVVQQDNATCTDARHVLRSPAGETGQARLPVGRPLTLDVALVPPGGGRACVNRWTFTPQAGRSYVLQSAIVGAACPARLLDTTQPDRAAVPPDLVNRVQAGQSCVPLDKAPKVASGGIIQGGQIDGEAVLLPLATTRPLQGLIKP